MPAHPSQDRSTQVQTSTVDNQAQTEGLVNTLISSLCLSVPGPSSIEVNSDTDKICVKSDTPASYESNVVLHTKKLFSSQTCPSKSSEVESSLVVIECKKELTDSIDYGASAVDSTSEIEPSSCSDIKENASDQNANSYHNIIDESSPSFKSSFADLLIRKKTVSQQHSLEPSNSTPQPMPSSHPNLSFEGDSKFDELKKRFESSEHLAKISGTPTTPYNVTPPFSGTPSSSDRLQTDATPLTDIISDPPTDATTTLTKTASGAVTAPNYTVAAPIGAATSHSGASSPETSSNALDSTSQSGGLTVDIVKDTISLMRNNLSKLSPRNLNLTRDGGLENYKSTDEIVNE